jgi:hypothetical protein
MSPTSHTDLPLSISEPQSVEEYIPYCQDQYDLIMWGGGKLYPYNLLKSHYNWVFFPTNLQPGYYRIALALLTFPKIKPVTAYAVAFPPGTKKIEDYPLSPIGFGFHITPAMASKNRFEIRRNTTRFVTQLSGEHTLAVTTRDFFAEVADVVFEVALFKSKMEYLYK